MSTLLLIDDEPDMLRLTALMLESSGHQVFLAGNGPDGLAMVATEPVQMVILDVMMPGMDGWEVCRIIKSQKSSCDIPVMLLTSRNQPLDRIIGTEVLHADAYLTKPFERQNLLETIQHLLSP
jgi:CheY-like chemotaxis protein